ncbi:dTMP kinase [Patescibacteria group bacterium]
MGMNKGKLIVIDGTDGSGKATQTEFLIERLKKEGLSVQTISFPQYGQKSAGMVEEYLSGKYGTASQVGPKPSSIFYAVDRFDASFKIKKWLESGQTVVSDRYVGSNMGHQGSKISDPDERMKFYEWNMNLEHELFGIPKPDLNVVLHVPAEISFKLAQDRGGWKADIKTDIHETDINHLKDSVQAYLDITNRFDMFKLVKCVENEKLLTREEIHNRVWELVSPLIKRI